MDFVNQCMDNELISFSELDGFEVSLSIKREDKLHPNISGNKYRKLKYNIYKANNENQDTLLTFGGAYSNHISAVAFAGKEFGFNTIGIIRGDELRTNFLKTLEQNNTLQYAYENGMKFEFVSRNDYRLKNNLDFIANLKKKYGRFYLIPEGGTNDLAIQGCEEILTSADKEFDIIAVPVGTGGTITGIINSSAQRQLVLGFPALKGTFLSEVIKKMAIPSKNWKLIYDYHFGGYAKLNEELVHFINKFKIETKIQLDPIYTGKMIYGLIKMIKKGQFQKGIKILAIHTGGIQGIPGMNSRLMKKKLPLIQ